MNTLNEIQLGTASGRDRRQAAKDLIDMAFKMAEKLEQSEAKINPLTESIVRSVRYLGEQAQRETYDRIQRALTLQIGQMTMEEVVQIEQACAMRRALLMGDVAAAVEKVA